MAKINPFKPNSPTPPGMFIGRYEQVDKLEAHLIQAKASQPSNFMIIGERGIGKTSLLMYLKYIAQGSIPVNASKLNFLVIDTDLSTKTT